MRLLSSAGTSATLAFSIASSLFGTQQFAMALPGQTFRQAQERLQDSELFFDSSFLEERPGYYTASTSFSGGDVVLYVLGEANTVNTETLQFRYTNSRVSFERESEYSLTFISDVWGNEIAQDYANSRYTDEIPGGIGLNHYYLGERYGYRRSSYNDPTTGGGIDSFTVMNRSSWEESRRGDRFCLANPNAGECLGL